MVYSGWLLVDSKKLQWMEKKNRIKQHSNSEMDQPCLTVGRLCLRKPIDKLTEKNNNDKKNHSHATPVIYSQSGFCFSFPLSQLASHVSFVFFLFYKGHVTTAGWVTFDWHLPWVGVRARLTTVSVTTVSNFASLNPQRDLRCKMLMDHLNHNSPTLVDFFYKKNGGSFPKNVIPLGSLFWYIFTYIHEKKTSRINC